MCLPRAGSRWEVHLLISPSCLSRLAPWRREERGPGEAGRGHAEPPPPPRTPALICWAFLPVVEKEALLQVEWAESSLPIPPPGAERALPVSAAATMKTLGRFWVPEPVLAPGQGVKWKGSRTQGLVSPQGRTSSLL